MSDKPGMKFDGGKLRYGLVPSIALRQVASVLTLGAEKYEPDNWQNIPDGIERYTDSLLRHIEEFRQGEDVDPDTCLHHLSHAACCLFFMLWFLQQEGRLPDFDDADVQKRLTAIKDAYAEKRLQAAGLETVTSVEVENTELVALVSEVVVCSLCLGTGYFSGVVCYQCNGKGRTL